MSASKSTEAHATTAANTQTVSLSRPSEVSLAQLPPLALYVHLPWCVRKCPYCDFNSHEVGHDAALPEEAYVDALIADLEHALPWIWGRRVSSIFFGGGTPSLFSARSLDRLLAAFRARIGISPDAEITLEANPGSVEAQKFRDYRQAGVNRLSLGIQSLDDAQLRVLGRIHTADEARRAIATAQRIFDQMNLDVMLALPGQDVEGMQRMLREVIGFGTPHLSAYQLTLEPNTVFQRYPPADLPSHDIAAAVQECAQATLIAAGYEHYETSAFARPNMRCRHNLNYWQFGDYLGLGAGAHGKLSFPDRIERHARIAQPREYMPRALQHDSILTYTRVRSEDLPFEFMLNALRLCEGVPLTLFRERTGLELTRIAQPLAQAEAQGLLERDHTHLRPTAHGQRFLNDLLTLFLP
jgi:oxygen-independent coproporphyrinogen-3 oxidase